MKKSDLVKIIKEALIDKEKKDKEEKATPLQNSVASAEFKMSYNDLGAKEKEWVNDEIDNIEYKKNKKKVNEYHEEGDDEYDTGGYVEAMGPELDKHIKAIAGIFQEWKNGPSTEPQMVGYATYDLIEYIKRAIRR